MNLVVYYQSNGKVVNHKYYIEVIDHDSCSSVKFDLITKRFIFFEKRRIRKLDQKNSQPFVMPISDRFAWEIRLSFLE